MQKKRRTKIIATIGPSCEDKKALRKMAILGVDMVRLNFSHNTHQWHKKIIENIRKIEKKVGRRIAIIADIQGPKIRVGILPEQGIQVKDGQKIVIDTNAKNFINNKIPLPSLLFNGGTKEGHIVFFDDGRLQAKITGKRGKIFNAVVLRGGTLFSRKGINAPDLKITSSILNAKDKSDIKFAIKNGVDYIALSFVSGPDDIKKTRKFLKNSKAKIIAKIERHEALVNLEKITNEADAVMVARGDLGIETPLWELPIRQKEIITLVRKMGKPAIVATQMLDSMINNPAPTRAEVSDVANAVFDSADAVMMSGETASGKYPIEALSMMIKILEATDHHCDSVHRNNLTI